MFIYAKLITLLLAQRWRAIREDDRGASTIEYLLLVLLGIAVATLALTAITKAVNDKDSSITGGTP